MYHYFNTLTNTRGDRLFGYRARCLTLSGSSVVPIYADENGTPIAVVSGAADTVITDETGAFDFWVEDGIYTIEILTPGGSAVRTMRGVILSAGSGGGSTPLSSYNGGIDGAADGADYTGGIDG